MRQTNKQTNRNQNYLCSLAKEVRYFVEEKNYFPHNRIGGGNVVEKCSVFGLLKMLIHESHLENIEIRWVNNVMYHTSLSWRVYLHVNVVQI